MVSRGELAISAYRHRKALVQKRLKTRARIFGVDVTGFAVMSNHLHVILRTRPDVVARWSDEVVARRWWRLFTRRCEKDGAPAELQTNELRMLTAVPAALAQRP